MARTLLLPIAAPKTCIYNTIHPFCNSGHSRATCTHGPHAAASDCGPKDVHLQHHTPILQQRSLTCYMHTWPARCCFRLRPQRRASTTPYTHSATAVTHVLHAHMARTLLLPIAAPKACIYNTIHPFCNSGHSRATCTHGPHAAVSDCGPKGVHLPQQHPILQQRSLT